MNPVDRMVTRWRWRRHRLPIGRRADERMAYGHELPRHGVPAALVLILAGAAVAAGIWLGGNAAESSAKKPASDPLASLGQGTRSEDRPILERVMAKLSTQRTDRRLELSLNHDSAAQAAAARTVGDAFRAAERSLVHADRKRFRNVITALRSAARGYDGLSVAAARHDGSAYAKAAAQVAAAEGALQQLIASRA